MKPDSQLYNRNPFFPERGCRFVDMQIFQICIPEVAGNYVFIYHRYIEGILYQYIFKMEKASVKIIFVRDFFICIPIFKIFEALFKTFGMQLDGENNQLAMTRNLSKQNPNIALKTQNGK